jgi:TonB family protein
MLERINNLKTNKKTSKSLFIVVILTTITMLSGLSYAGNQHDNVGAKATESTHLEPVMRVNPKYPIKAAQKGMEGSVVLRFDVTANGSVTNVEVVNAKPAYVFDKSAVSALEKWKYSAIGHKVEGLLVQLDFAMDKDSKLESLIERIKVTQ